jgi:hypothetical protein
MFEIWGVNPHDAVLPGPYSRAHSPDRSVGVPQGYEMNKALPSAIAFIVLLLAGVPAAKAEPALTCRPRRKWTTDPIRIGRVVSDGSLRASVFR